MTIADEIRARIDYLMDPEVAWVQAVPSRPTEACLFYDYDPHDDFRLAFSMDAFLFVLRHRIDGAWNDTHTFGEVIDLLRELEIEAKDRHL